MKKAIALSVCLAASTLAGCASAPSTQETAAADYGSYPADFEQIIRNHMSRKLKDPESARYEFLNQPKAAWATLGGKKFGYAVCTNINAKNSFGGYVGSRPSYFLIRNGAVISESHGDGNYADAWVQGRCKAIVNQ